jgi:hypothetical protein
MDWVLVEGVVLAILFIGLAIYAVVTGGKKR